MNYLAHAYLSGEDGTILLGNLVADAAGGAEIRRLPAPVLKGVHLHWDIDAFADAHPEFRYCLDLFGPECRRYAAVIVDVLFDHFLAKHWHRFSDQPLPKFAASVYSRLDAARGLLSNHLRQLYERMRNDDWLNKYGTLAGVEKALVRLASRSQHFRDVKAAMADIEARYAELEACFLRFFPELIRYVRTVTPLVIGGLPAMLPVHADPA